MSGKRAPAYAWTDSETAKLAELWSRGDDIEQIAEALGRSVSAVQTKAGRMSLPARRWPTRQHSTARIRPCMCCGNTFFSTWIGNRICEPCKESDLYRSAA